MNIIAGKLQNREQAQKWLAWALRQIEPMLAEGKSVMCELFDGKTREQEKLYHSCFRDLARDCLLNGQKATPDDWKSVMKQAFYEATKHDPDFVEDWRTRRPHTISNLTGDGLIYVPIESKRFTKNLARAFITFIHATGDERGVRWSRTSLGREWAELAEAPE